ncbi:MAG: hypothetical protein K2W95_10335 [Candidatus Obscuribacterales bacterium]|nr:hypothetical protein [Candidatus Obscuribacterales bacterium]
MQLLKHSLSDDYVCYSIVMPVTAQDAFDSTDATGWQSHATANVTGAQAMQFAAGNAAALQCTKNKTICPVGADATALTGVSTSGTVRVSNLANVEALMNFIANGIEIQGLAWGGPLIVIGFMCMSAERQEAMRRIIRRVSGARAD